MTQKSDSRHRSGEELSEQEVTAEQLNDVFAAGTSDGAVQLADETVTVTDDGYETKTEIASE